jgi:hypothetical protein
MTTPAPNLYQLFNLDPHDDCTELGLLLAGKTARLEQTGIGEASSNRLNIAYGVLSEKQHRTLYDDTIQLRQLTWSELEHLANFGKLPAPYLPPMYTGESPPTPQSTQSYPPPPTQAAQPVPGMPTFGTTAQPPAVAHGAASLAPISRAIANRPTGLARGAMAAVDMFLATIVAAFAIVPIPIEALLDEGGIMGLVLMAMVCGLYMVGCEAVLGATPAKLIFGYTVRDVTTGQKLSWRQSAKRNWWRLINVVPGLGSTVSFIAAIANFFSINQNNELRGMHDRFANAEVTKKNQ